MVKNKHSGSCKNLSVYDGISTVVYNFLVLLLIFYLNVRCLFATSLFLITCVLPNFGYKELWLHKVMICGSLNTADRLLIDVSPLLCVIWSHLVVH